MSKTNTVGRPTKMTNSIVQKIKEAIKIGSSIEEACSYAKISKTTFYDWKGKNQEFSNEIEDSKTYLLFKSKQAIAKSIESGDTKCAMWYLERKARMEFNLNHLKDEPETHDRDPLRKRLLEIKARKQEEANKKKKKKKIIVIKK